MEESTAANETTRICVAMEKEIVTLTWSVKVFWSVEVITVLEMEDSGTKETTVVRKDVLIKDHVQLEKLVKETKRRIICLF